MNAPDPNQHPAVERDPQIRTRNAAKALFPLECLQHLDAESAGRCQSILGHGATYGTWLTPEEMLPILHGSTRTLDLRIRLTAYLPEELLRSPTVDALLYDGVLYLTRLALLMRMGPAGLNGMAKGKPLDVSTTAGNLHTPIAKLVARCIERRLAAGADTGPGFVSALTADDLAEFRTDRKMRSELKRLAGLHDRGLWPDAPVNQTFRGKTTAVRGAAKSRPNEKKSIPFPPLPDEYMAAIGPCVLWLIKDLGPNLIHLLQTLPELLGARKFLSNYSINHRIARYFEQNVWRDRHGQILTPPAFTLRHGTASGQHMRKDFNQFDPCEWPPRNWWSVNRLAVTLQRAHLWLACLVMSSRISEILTLKRYCVAKARDGQWYVNGKTYKPSRRLGGKKKESPPPAVLVQTLAQQARLVEACERLAKLLDDKRELDELAAPGTNLWASLGPNGNADATQQLKGASAEFIRLAETLGLETKPGGKNIHPHRLRKTIARLAGIAIDGSQKVLMLLLGHDDVTTTLLYMQSDPAFAKEIDDVTRELRILRAEGLITDMHAALHTPDSLSYGGHGGGGAHVLSKAVRTHEERLHREGKEWDADSARELAVLLTNNGESARLVSAHVVCTKTGGEMGMCSQKKGGIVPGNCQVECPNHIEEATGRRDTQRVIPILVQHAKQNTAEGNWLVVENDKRQLVRELNRYDDIGTEWRAKPEVRAILEARNE